MVNDEDLSAPNPSGLVPGSCEGLPSTGDWILGLSRASKEEVVTFVSTQTKKTNHFFLILVSGHQGYPSF